MANRTFKNHSKYIFISVIIIALVRIMLTGAIPLLDKTESRYAEIARLMYETKEWVVLQIDYGNPFWAKPPLSTWLSALSFKIFGVNEIAARLPSFLLGIGLLLILGNLVKRSKISFYVPAFILLTTPEFLLHTGVVSTDTALSFSVALIMISFWKALTNKSYTYWNYLFFAAVGLGLLSKGPMVLVLTGPPILIWLFIHKIKFRELFHKLPWLIGIVIAAIVAVPWYVLTEMRSPGFIDYFIVGEHFKRFLVSGWEGDLYGSGHSQPRGMIWVFLMLFAFPWIQIVFFKLWKVRKSIINDKWVSFLAIWLLWTPIFFTLSSNILHTYILPVMVPMALLMAHWWGQIKNKKQLIIAGSIFPVMVIVAFAMFTFSDKWNAKMNSDKYLLANQHKRDVQNTIPIYYWKHKTYSGQFYSKGSAKVVSNPIELDSVVKFNEKLVLIVLKKRLKEIPGDRMIQFNLIESNYKTSLFLLEK